MKLNIWSKCLLISALVCGLSLATSKNKSTRANNLKLIEAVKNDQLALVKDLLGRKVDVNAKTKGGNTALVYTAMNNNLNIAKLLLKHGAHITTDVLANAIGSAKPEFLKFFLSRNTNPSILNDEFSPNHITLLQFTVTAQHPIVAQNILEKSGDRSLYAKYKNDLPAYRSSLTESVKVLLEHGAKVDAKGGGNENTPLMLASYFGTLETVRLLLKHGANINASNNSGHTALMIASNFGNLEIARLLLEHGANVNALDNSGNTALILASQSADINTSNNSPEDTALMLASQKNKVDITKLLLEHGANVNALNNNGDTALMLASQSANINASNDSEHAALMLAFQKNNFDTTKLLLEYGANINASNNSGDTALMIASHNDHLDIKNILEEALDYNDKLQQAIKDINSNEATTLFSKINNLSVDSWEFGMLFHSLMDNMPKEISSNNRRILLTLIQHISSSIVLSSKHLRNTLEKLTQEKLTQDSTHRPALPHDVILYKITPEHIKSIMLKKIPWIKKYLSTKITMASKAKETILQLLEDSITESMGKIVKKTN